MDTNKNIEANSSSFDDIEEKIHANQVLYDQLHQSLVDESIAQVDEDERKCHPLLLKIIFKSLL